MAAGRPESGLGFTRARDLLVVALVAAVAGFLVVRFSYSRIPALPRLAGSAAALLGVAEALFGLALRRRIVPGRDPVGGPARPPVPPLLAARALLAGKATALAGAALAGLWVGLLGYVLPRSGQVDAARADLPTAVIGLVGAVVMTGGALVLEACCRTPTGTGGSDR